jgi:hypothetical protein
MFLLELAVVAYFIKTFPVQEVNEMMTSKLNYIYDIWNYYEWTIIIVRSSTFFINFL